MSQAELPAILFTAFEPSGDDHASAVIAELKRRRPGLRVFAWGGPKMAAAGAELVGRTGENAVMGVPGLSKVLEHRRINKAVERWMGERGAELGVVLHVPVDSPAANFPICAISRKFGLRIVHLVAPQIWAWGSWRIKKLRRLTDRVLCLLPFEEAWFNERGVKATFIGHPLFDEVVDVAAADAVASEFPTPGVEPGDAPAAKVAILPGSRPGEMRSCLPCLLDAFRRLSADFPKTVGVVAATRQEVADAMVARAERELGGWPERLAITSGQTDAVIRWCDFALVVSGTVTLQVAKQHRPMVAVYRPNWLMYQCIGRWIVSTKLFTLPNLIAGREVVPEYIPHFGNGEKLAIEAIRLMRQPGYADDQVSALRGITSPFLGRHASSRAADAIEKALGLEPSGGGDASNEDSGVFVSSAAAAAAKVR